MPQCHILRATRCSVPATAPLQGRKGDFFTFRHTGASHLAQQARDGAHIIKIVKMMGDTNVKTVEKHYFNFDDEMMADMTEGWEAPTLESLAQPLDVLDDSPELTNQARSQARAPSSLKPLQNHTE